MPLNMEIFLHLIIIQRSSSTSLAFIILRFMLFLTIVCYIREGMKVKRNAKHVRDLNGSKMVMKLLVNTI